MSIDRRMAAQAGALVVLACQLAGQNGAAGGWPDFRGPSWNGRVAAARVPLKWSESNNVRWKTKLTGEGWSSPVVWDDRIWLTTATERGKRLHVVAVDAQTGEELHERVLFEVERPEHKNALNSYASPSPTVEAGRVYVHFGTYGTACLDTESFATLWQRRDLNCDHMEGPGSSPILYQGLLIFNVDGGDVQYVIALDRQTGKTQWRTDRSVDLTKWPPDLRKAYSTPILAEVDGSLCLVSSGAQATMAYDPLTGKELWRVRYAGYSMASRPLADDGLLFLTTGFTRARMIAVQAAGEGDVTDDNIVWSYRHNVPKMSSPLVVRGRVYMVDDSGIATCLAAESGENLWRQRIGGEHCASPICVGDRIYFFDRDGRTVVLGVADKFQKLATNQLADGFMASPAVVGEAFILRTKTHLYRIEERQ